MSDLKIFRLDGAYSQVGSWIPLLAAGVRLDSPCSSALWRRTPECWSPNAPGLETSGALRRRAIGSGGEGYVNALDEFGEDRLRRCLRLRQEDKLARIKAVYDPDNVFHHNANIKPA